MFIQHCAINLKAFCTWTKKKSYSNLKHTSYAHGYAYGYAYGVAPTSKLPAMPMGMPKSHPSWVTCLGPPVLSHLSWATVELNSMPMAMPMGWPQPQSYQLCLWLCLWGGPNLKLTSYAYGYAMICLWGGPNLKLTSYAYGYAYGVAPASKLPAMPMAMPMRWPQPQSYQFRPCAASHTRCD
jgi:hypothetical protein